MMSLLVTEICRIYELFSFAVNVQTAFRRGSTAVGGPCLACFSCLLIVPDGHSQPFSLRVLAHFYPRQLVSYLYTYDNKLSPLPVPQRQHQTFLTLSCPFRQGNATQCKNVAVVISPVRLLFLSSPLSAQRKV